MSTAPTEPQTAPIDTQAEILACAEDFAYFVDNYCKIFDPIELRDWFTFHLWPDQITSLDTLHRHNKVVILKARQLGFSWLVLCYALWLMIFRPAAVILIFSKRDDEAVELLSFRLKGIYQRLPDWLKIPGPAGSGHGWALPNGSRAMAFPTTGGRSYTGSMVIVDESDYIPNLNSLLTAVKPTVDAGGKIVLLSTSDKKNPLSPFKLTYMGAKAKENGWQHIFCSWRSRPERDEAWYEEQRRDIQTRTGAIDDLWQEYPDTDTQALAAAVLDKRIAPAWLEQCYQAMEPLTDKQLREWHDTPPVRTWSKYAPAIPQLVIYAPPVQGRLYVIAGDPAEGNPTSDDSSATVLDQITGEEVAQLTGKIEPSVFAGYIDQIGCWYNCAPAMIERNNHGHAVILWLEQNGHITLLNGHDDNTGWLSSAKGKAILYDDAADAFRNKETVLHSFETWSQLGSIEGNTLRAPEPLHDDRADSYALALAGVKRTRGNWSMTISDPKHSEMANAPAGLYTESQNESMVDQMTEMGW